MTPSLWHRLWATLFPVNALLSVLRHHYITPALLVKASTKSVRSHQRTHGRCPIPARELE